MSLRRPKPPIKRGLVPEEEEEDTASLIKNCIQPEDGHSGNGRNT
jgi:hypothetical protein